MKGIEFKKGRVYIDSGDDILIIYDSRDNKVKTGIVAYF